MHKYAKEMMAMAEASAKSADKPFRVIEFQNINCKDKSYWSTCDSYPNFDNPYYRFRIKPKEKKKLWQWVLIDENGHINHIRYLPDDSSMNMPRWHKTNTFIEIEGE